MNESVDNSTILNQASAFNGSGKIYAPRYRQAHYHVYVTTDKDDKKKSLDVAYSDVKASFEYYLKNYNQGRPIVIASHSQGTTHATRLIKEFFDNKPLQNKLVCAYIIGLPVPENYYITIPVCKDSAATGCLVSWRTYQRGYEIKQENLKAVVVNPLNWTMDTSFIPAKQNIGGVLLKFNKIIPQVVDANIHNNILWTSKPNVFGKILFNKKNYHVGDINLFYMNIRQNVKTRISSYLKRQQIAQ